MRKAFPVAALFAALVFVMESGGKILDDAVVSTVQKWKYAPAVKKGIKVKARHTVKQTFRAG